MDAAVAIEKLGKSFGSTRALDGLSAVPGVHNLRVDGSHVEFMVDPGSLDPALVALTSAGVTGLTSRPPTLEELFLRHYGVEEPATHPTEMPTA